MSLSKDEIERYSRHLTMPEFGMEQQKRLKASKILVIGAGGLGSPALLYLTAAGVGTIGIIEFDEVDLSNLQRQILYGTSDVGQSKISRAVSHLSQTNPHVQFVQHPSAITSQNAREIIRQYDIVVDGTDNFPTRYLINDACVLEGKPNVYGSVLRFEGQVSVFNQLGEDGSYGPNYRDLYPTPPPAGLVPNCAEAGVLGVLPGIIGSMQASEAIKLAAGIGNSLKGRIWIFDALSFESRTMRFKKSPDNKITGLIDYQTFCGLPPENKNQLSPKEVHQLVLANLDVQVIDVREPYEYELDHINAISMPLTSLLDQMDDINPDKELIVLCQSGKRSAQAIRLIKNEFNDIRVYNLRGGMNAWRKDMGRISLPNQGNISMDF